ncbi:MAG: TVP38/TMEM64 family protein [Candidatus Omnitrophica bacterium]|nr:TVP38/TMEM64 family protein [Candidatus Omnitrophota bacterium]
MNIRKHRHEIEFFVLIIVLFWVWYAGRSLRLDPDTIINSLRAFPLFYSSIIYVFLYVIVSFFIFFSKDVFWLTGALFFGPGYSTVLICISEAINAYILFYLARRFGRGFVEKRVAEKYRHLDEKLGRISFIWLFIFRAAPLIPYRFMDLAAGLTRIKFTRYFLAVILGSPLKMFWVQSVLYGVGKNILTNPVAIIGYFQDNRILMYVSLIYVVLVIMVVFKISSRD